MKKVFITGGNKGIGLEITKLFLEADFRVIVAARDFEDFPYKNHSNLCTRCLTTIIRLKTERGL
ncbi:MAG: SDR family NAD(P)-dependent oxidoreductase [Acetivibrio ethanolgignens]